MLLFLNEKADQINEKLGTNLPYTANIGGRERKQGIKLAMYEYLNTKLTGNATTHHDSFDIEGEADDIDFLFSSQEDLDAFAAFITVLEIPDPTIEPGDEFRNIERANA